MDVSTAPNSSQEDLAYSVVNKNNWNESTTKTVPTIQNATNSHPLMYSPTSPVSTYPDLIPNEHVSGSPEKLRIENYEQVLPDFPHSPSAIKKTLLLDISLDLSDDELSDKENDKSVYEAHLSSNFEHVSLTMNENEGNLNFLAHERRSNKLRKVKVVQTETSPDDSDVSSLESFNESLRSEDVFVGNAALKDNRKRLSPVGSESPVEAIETLSADEERECERFWQPIVLPGGEQRRIDMRVIEPYKRVLSHGGYLRAGCHTALVVFSACFLPDRSRVDYDYVMDNLFLYILWTLDRLVTDDYVLIYLHGGATHLPSFGWLKKCYTLVSRRLRKNLVHLYLVHPTMWIKTVLFMAKPFISFKFFRKITYVNNLKELFNRIDLESNAIPDKVKTFDAFRFGSS